MQSKSYLVAFCGLTVLSLGLISCNRKDNSVAAKPWGVSEPVIVSSTGVTIKYTEVNTLTNHTYSVDDRLVLKDISTDNPSSQLRFRTSCVRGEDRVQYADQLILKPEYTLLEFMPQSLLYSVHGTVLTGAHCTLEVSVINAAGARQNFPTLNLVMSDVSQNNFELLYNLQPISREKPTTINIENLSALTFSQIASQETLKLQCETLTGTSRGVHVQNLADFNMKSIESSPDNSMSQKSQFCRVYKMVGQSVKALSPFFILSFFDNSEISGEIDNTHLSAHGSDMNHLTGLSFRRHQLKNPSDQTIYLKLPKSIGVEIAVKSASATLAGTSRLHISLKEGKQWRETADTFTVELKPLEYVIIEYKLTTRYSCRSPIAAVVVKLQSPLPYIQAVTADGEIVIAQWPLITEEFKPFLRDVVIAPAGNDRYLPRECKYY